MADTLRPQDDRVTLVRTFYRALADRDSAALEGLVAKAFSPEVTLVLPDSLPYGGTVTGAGRLARMFGRMASSPVRVGPVGPVVTAIVDGGDRIGAQLEFDWYPPGSPHALSTGALELWTFDGDGLVREIRAYYWDTAACAALVPTTDS
ncbi:nuclear transport factor 2 family protein [Streptomyces arenae]|uniref:nuclear transport factor 2 family protein n=1 Tax=Streptomyces arenae TaxID=29301 RepID=UPI00265AC91F|nr:hypothetical protein [Streptomyces arenae]MCG7207407.1 hypothetical protein [Streptomyces arenae]